MKRRHSILPLFLGAMLAAGCGGGGLFSSFRSGSSAPTRSTPAPKFSTAPLTFPDGQTIEADIASTPKAREYGLMFRTTLPIDYGMLFVFPREQQYEFWMKNTLVNLDMIFIDGHRKITEVYKSVPRSAQDTPEANLARRDGIAQYVLELPEGSADRHRLKVGQEFRFSVPAPTE